MANAKAFLAVQREFGRFDAYVWSIVRGPHVQPTAVLQPGAGSHGRIGAPQHDLSDAAFKFVGSTICYAFMQAVGMVNDHTVDCFRYQELSAAG